MRREPDWPDPEGTNEVIHVRELAYPQDRHIQDLCVLCSRMEGLVQGHEPYVLHGHLRECEATGKRRDLPGLSGIGDLALLSGAHARGAEVSILAHRILRRCNAIIAEECEKFLGESGDGC